VGEGDGGGAGAGIGGASSGGLGGGAGVVPLVRSCISALTHIINPARTQIELDGTLYELGCEVPALGRGLGTGRTEA